MYKIIGGDGNEYGPVTAEQLRQWMTEGRVNAQTQVKPEGAAEWQSLSAFPELGAAATVPTRQAAPIVAGSVPNYLTQAILVTICCCVPFGIPAIIFAAQVNSKLAAVDLAGAQDASRKARMWCWIAFGLGLLAGLVYVVIGAAQGFLAVRFPHH